MVVAMDDEVRGFSMPGTGIPGFAEHAKRIANAGIYDLTIHHEQILVPMVMRHWDLEGLEGLSRDGEDARERLVKYMAKSERVAKRLAERRETAAAELTTV
jgi:acyl-[acyl-carrier-protein] desaturase